MFENTSGSRLHSRASFLTLVLKFRPHVVNDLWEVDLENSRPAVVKHFGVSDLAMGKPIDDYPFLPVNPKNQNRVLNDAIIDNEVDVGRLVVFVDRLNDEPMSNSSRQSESCRNSSRLIPLTNGCVEFLLQNRTCALVRPSYHRLRVRNLM